VTRLSKKPPIHLIGGGEGMMMAGTLTDVLVAAYQDMEAATRDFDTLMQRSLPTESISSRTD
jgi:hypothetical protein